MNREEKIALLREHLRQDGIQVDGMSDEDVLQASSQLSPAPKTYTSRFLIKPRYDTGGSA